jgi:hypothetical protein
MTKRRGDFSRAIVISPRPPPAAPQNPSLEGACKNMHWTKALSLACCCLAIAAFLAVGLPGTDVFAAEQKPILTWLFTWSDKQPDKEDADEGEQKEQQEETKEEPLESDRPDFTESSTTVGRKRLQIESGYRFTQAKDGDRGDNSHDLPELLVRYGVAERLEVRVAWDEGMVFERNTNPSSGRTVTSDGSTDLSFGFKYAISKQKDWFPRTAVIAAVTAPMGSATQGSRQVDAQVNFCYSWEFTKKLSLSCSTGNECTREMEDHFTRFFHSMSIDYELMEKLHAFNEWSVFCRINANDNHPQHYYDGGFTYLVTPNFQLDWSAGVGLSAVSDGFFTGCGLTIRR